MEKLNEDDCELLMKEFTMEDLKTIVFEMAVNKAAGRDGFNAEFYQKIGNW
jgi:hypothetical protein